tara:strand:+ start:2308 stop:3234 length:927 start_codon:yes stop_codon:yes gene_type:complete
MYRLINTLFNYVTIIILILIINSCAHFKIEKLEKNEFNGKDVFSLLSKEYKNFAKYELYDMHDELDANYFAYKGLIALNDNIVFPENPKKWKLSEENFNIFMKYFTHINELIEQQVHKKDPKVFSKMLIGYDCWIEQQEENWQTNHIKKCKDQFESNYEKIINALNNKEPKKSISSKRNKDNIINEDNTEEKNPNVILEEKLHVRVFFNFDSFMLNSAEKNKLQDIIEKAKKNKELTIYIEGHTDTKGPHLYNLALSNKRASFIRNYLKEIKVMNKILIEGFGEKKPLLTTLDNVKEKKNRRAEVTIK